MHLRRRGGLVAAVLCSLALLAAACGGDSGESGGGGGGGADLPDCPLDALEEASGPVEVTLWYAYAGQIEQSILQLVDEYNASQDQVVVNAQSQGQDYRELQRQFNQGIQSGQLPDIAILEDTQNQFMADSGVVLPAAACYEAGGEEPDFLPAAVTYYSLDEVQWPAGFNISSPILYYNKNHFEQAGLDPEDPPDTLDEVREASEAIQESGAADTPFVFLMSPWIVENWLKGVGQEIVNEDNGRAGLATEANFENEQFIEILQWLKDMNDDGLMAPFPNTENQVNHYLALAQENGSMGMETSAAATSIEAFLKGELDPSELTDDERVVVTDDLDLNLDIGAGLLPGVEEAGQVQVGGGAWYMTTAGAPEQQAAAFDFMSFINSEPSQVVNNLVGSYLPSIEPAADNPEIQETWQNTLSGQWLALSYDQVLEVSPDFPGPSIGPYTEEREILATGLEALLLEGASPEDVAADIQAQVNEALATYEDQNF